jgi:hypothetical protein
VYHRRLSYQNPVTGDRPAETLHQTVVDLVKNQEFDGTVICKLQGELAHLKRENARLRDALESLRTHCRLAVVHFRNGMVEISPADEVPRC